MAKRGPLSNQKLGDKYLLGELLGQGGFGAVYTARHMLLNREQAVKILLDQYFTNLEFRDRFIREARTLAALAHPNIVHVDDFGFDGDRAYLVMPYIGGGTLQDVLKRRGTFGLDEVRRYVEEICAALEYAHVRNIAHLDLKPLNLLISTDQHILLSDFGLAHLLEQGLVKGGASLEFGTPQYMAPEQWQGQPDQRSDLYSLGVLIYRMLADRLPFEEENFLALRYKHETETPPLLRTIRPELPVELEEIVAKLLAKRPDDRYQTVGQFLGAFTLARLRYMRQTLAERGGQPTTPLPPVPDEPPDPSAAPPLPDLPSLEGIVQAARTALRTSPVSQADDVALQQPSELADAASSESDSGEDNTFIPAEFLPPTHPFKERNAGAPVLSAQPFEKPARRSSGNFLVVLHLLTLLCGIVGLAAFFFFPWLDLQVYGFPDQISMPSGLSLALSGNQDWLLLVGPLGSADLIVLVWLQSKQLANYASGSRWMQYFITATPLFPFAMLLVFFTLLWTGVLYDGSHYSLITYASGFWLGLVSLVLGCVGICAGAIYSGDQSSL